VPNRAIASLLENSVLDEDIYVSPNAVLTRATPMQVPNAHIYGIIGHNLPEGETAPDGIELYTEELVEIQLDLQELEQRVTELSIDRFGGVDSNGEDTSGISTLVARLHNGLSTPNEIQELEHEYQSVIERIAGAREALVSGHLSRAGIDPDDYSSRYTQRHLYKWVDDGTFPNFMQELETAVDRVGHRLAAKRETVNTRVTLLVSLITLGTSMLLVVFAMLTLVATII
jgi:hypothetical protein